MILVSNDKIEFQNDTILKELYSNKKIKFLF